MAKLIDGAVKDAGSAIGTLAPRKVCPRRARTVDRQIEGEISAELLLPVSELRVENFALQPLSSAKPQSRNIGWEVQLTGMISSLAKASYKLQSSRVRIPIDQASAIM